MIRLLAALTVASLAIAGCDGPGTGADDRPPFPAGTYMAEIHQRGSVRIGVSSNVVQFGAQNLVTGSFEGLEVDVGTLVAERLGVPPQFVAVPAGAPLELLQQDKADLVIAQITDEVQPAPVELSSPYYEADGSMLIKKDAAHLIRDVGSLNVKGSDDKVRAGCVADPATEASVRAAAPGATVVSQPVLEVCLQMLVAGQVTAVIADDALLVGLVKVDSRNLTIVEGGLAKSPYRIAMKPGRDGFRQFVDRVIREAKRNGTLAELEEKWVKSIKAR